MNETTYYYIVFRAMAFPMVRVLDAVIDTHPLDWLIKARAGADARFSELLLSLEREGKQRPANLQADEYVLLFWQEIPEVVYVRCKHNGYMQPDANHQV